MRAEHSRILVVDDEVKMCKTLQKILKKRGYQTETAFDGKQALKQVTEFQPHCVLLDIRMPEINGYDVLKEIKSLDSKIAVLITSAVADEETSNRCLKAGAADFIQKPVNFEKLLNQIEQILLPPS